MEKMDFRERLKSARGAAGLSQVALAEAAGVTVRTVQNYETGARRPHNIKIAGDLAKALGVKVESLLGTEGILTLEAYEKGGARAERDIAALVGEVTGLFSGGTLPEEDMDAVMEALNRAYFDAKMRNRKYGRKNQRGCDS